MMPQPKARDLHMYVVANIPPMNSVQALRRMEIIE